MKKFIPLIIVVVIIGGALWAIVSANNKPGQYDKLAQCIADSGTKFYGAFWCPHCQATKAMFGKSAKLLPYVECSAASGSGQLQICIDQQIEGYPTWEIAEPITITSDTDPIMCHPTTSTEAATDPDTCKTSGVASQYRNVWIFPGSRLIAKDAPTITKGTWVFPAGTRVSGELTLDQLAEKTSCPLQ